MFSHRCLKCPFFAGRLYAFNAVSHACGQNPGLAPQIYFCGEYAVWLADRVCNACVLHFKHLYMSAELVGVFGCDLAYQAIAVEHKLASHLADGAAESFCIGRTADEKAGYNQEK